uniref:Uncharacterized protein n=1 Tax=Lutzomyia longipalpis TaxID=7200 RepID=A0A7G3B5I0_LUTLO
MLHIFKGIIGYNRAWFCPFRLNLSDMKPKIFSFKVLFFKGVAIITDDFKVFLTLYKFSFFAVYNTNKNKKTPSQKKIIQNSRFGILHFKHSLYNYFLYNLYL